MKKVLRSPFFYVAALIVLAAVLIGVLRTGSSPQNLSLQNYTSMLHSHQVSTAVVHDDTDTITGKLGNGASYTVSYPDRLTQQVMGDIATSKTNYQVSHTHTSIWVSLLESYLPILLLFGLFLFLLNSTQAGGSRLLQFGRAKAKTASKDDEQVTFSDVAGADEAVAELEEIRDFLEAPDRFYDVGAKIPRGVLLVGPPGTGKTLLARAVAGEAGVPFYSISGSDFVEMFVGVGASRVRDLFHQAKQNSPSIVFVDEIDAVGRQRGAGVGGGHDEREQTLNQLLVELDGFDVRGGVILIAATNRPDILDPALLRPGRFDRQIVVDRPDLAGRRRILNVHAREKPLHPSVDLETLAKRTPGFTGADLANLLNEAALLTARRNLQSVGMRECEEAIDRVLAGPERKTLVMSDRDKWVTAYHEAGHVLVGHVLPYSDEVHKVSIVARSRSLGLTFTLPEDKFNHTRRELQDTMAMCMGGRTAEELVFSDPTTGAENDIEKATGIARSMVTEYGMSDLLGPQHLVAPSGDVFLGREGAQAARSAYSELIAGEVDGEVRRLIDDAHARATAILTQHRATLDALATELVDKETLDTPELMAIIGTLPEWHEDPDSPVFVPPWTAPARPAPVRQPAAGDAAPAYGAPAEPPRRRRPLVGRPAPGSQAPGSQPAYQRNSQQQPAPSRRRRPLRPRLEDGEGGGSEGAQGRRRPGEQTD